MPDDRSVSSLEIRPLHVARERYDVVIMGGGLAGLTLAIQLKQRRPDTSIAVLEKREGPAPLAAFKVGESTVPSGAHYFEKVVGMEDHLKKDQLIKIGLRFFLTAGDNEDITKRIEQGAAGYPPHDNWQIDRGVFENELASRARAMGVDVLGGCRVRDVEIGDELHVVSFTQMDEDVTTKGRWVVDATGRASLLKRKFGLSKDVAHTINAAWRAPRRAHSPRSRSSSQRKIIPYGQDFFAAASTVFSARSIPTHRECAWRMVQTLAGITGLGALSPIQLSQS